MVKLKATEKLERLLSMIPWIMDNEGPTLHEVAKRFGYPEVHLLNDLTKVLFMVGPYPHTPDTLIDVLVEDGRVWIEQADWLSRPVRLTPEQAFSILRKAKTMELLMGDEDNKDLLSAVKKIEASLGQRDKTFDVTLPEFRNNVGTTIRQSIDTGRQVEIAYYSYSQDQSSDRTVHPIQIISRDSNQYLFAYCEKANDLRLFRIDRILNAELISKSSSPPKESEEQLSGNEMWDFGETNSLVTLKVLPEDTWIASTYPVERIAQDPDGFFEVDLFVTGIAWLKRLLLRLNPETKIVEAPDHIPFDLANQTAQAILDRYKE